MEYGPEWKPKEYVTEPRSGSTVTVLRDYWWAVNAAGEVCFYKYPGERYGVPQCNSSRSIAEAVRKKTTSESVGVEQIPLAFVPIDVTRNY
jgi:hypothetical protein